ncbi:MAG TPA: hypothetical protein VMU67_01625 [Steroidobacteraceae bacterium]|nr:hypothetical protein [Steroidobacteraceae bacterium]
MKMALAATVIVAMFAGGNTYADCTYPKPPDKIPDGNTATLQQMVAAQRQFIAYNQGIKAYTDCLRTEHDQAIAKADPTKMTKEQRAELDKVFIQKNDAAVDAATSVTNRFNEQVRAFKTKGQK